MVLYEEGLLYFDENRKWRERYVVVRANYCLECHESLQVSEKRPSESIRKFCSFGSDSVPALPSVFCERSPSDLQAAAYRGHCFDHRGAVHGNGGQLLP